MVETLMRSAKLTSLGFLKRNVFWNKGYDVIIFANNVINKILFGESIYIVSVFMWPKFDNFSISTRGIVITSFLWRFD